MRRHTGGLVLAGAICAAASAGIGLGLGGDQHGLQLATRYTARAAFLLFLLPFLASTLHGWRRNELTAAIVRERRGLGLAFAAAHFIHLGFIAAFLSHLGPRPSALGLAMGAPAYLGLVALTLTSTDAAVRALGAERWRRLHTAALWYIWLVFLLTYARGLSGKPGYALPIAVLLLAALARLNRRFLAGRLQAPVG